MNNKPIIIVNGEPYSIFLEIFFKSKKKNYFKKTCHTDCVKKDAPITNEKIGVLF